MAGPTGFVQRFKGKVAFALGGIWIAGTKVSVAAADLNSVSGSGTATTSTSSTAAPVSLTGAAGVANLAPVALTGGSIYRLPTPVVGGEKVINYSTINGSTVVFISASTDGTIVFGNVGSTGSTAAPGGSGGSTLSNTIKSTQSCTISLVGLSTTTWLFKCVAASTSAPLTWSTST